MSDFSEPRFPLLQEPEQRIAKRTWRGNLLRWLGRLLVLALIASVGMLSAKRLFSKNGKKNSIALEAPDAKKPTNKTVTIIASNFDAPGKNSASMKIAEQSWERAVVTIESHSRESRHVHGSGVMVAGYVATNLHVSRACLEATVQFSDDTRYEVAGYAAVDTEHDLALLRLHDAPSNLPSLSLAAEEPAPRSKVWAIGHPRGIEFSITTGEVSRVVTTTELPQSSRKFLLNLMPDVPSTRWVQHSARVAPGNSGGPLIDEAGQLLGINTWVDERAQFSYALHGQHLAALLATIKSDTPIPLEEYATTAARSNQALLKLSPERIQNLMTQAKAMRWRPTNREEYRTLQNLAYAITVSLWPDALSARGSLEAKLDELAKTADQAVRELQRQDWHDPAQITFLNEFAADELEQPQRGLFFYATIERLVEGDDGRRGLIANLAGFDRPIFLALPSDQLSVPEAKAQCIVIGVNQNGQEVKYGDNPLKPIHAPIIATRTIVVLGK